MFGDRLRRNAGVLAAVVLLLAAMSGGAVGASVPPPGPATGGWVRLSPTEGPPGTLVRVSGFLPSGPTPAQAARVSEDQSMLICWDGCADGLDMTVNLTWSARRAGAFTARFRVPRAAWLSPSGPRPLVPGPYAVGVDPAGAPLALQATFRLTGPRPARCGHAQPCAYLAVAPRSAAPGTVVTVSGWAPLLSVSGSPYAYTMLLGPAAAPRSGPGQEADLGLSGEGGLQLSQDPAGRLSGSFVLPPRTGTFGAVAPGAYRLTLAGSLSGPGYVPVATASLRVTAPEAWAAVGDFRPLAIQAAAPAGARATAAGDPAYQGRCLSGGGIAVSRDGGHTWAKVSTVGARVAARRAGYVLFGPGMPGSKAASPPCATLALLAARPGTLLAAFPAEQGSPGDVPIYWLSMETADGGRTWRLIPAPKGLSVNAFSRFQTYGTALQAWFWGGPTGLPTRYAIEQTADGGRTWTPGALHCPAAGPCLVFGPAPTWTWPGVCNGQALLWSGDGGRTWRLPVWPQQVCYVGTGPGGPYQIAAIGGRSALLLGGWNYPARLTVDGGRTWRDIALPLLPGMKPGGLYEPPYSGLHMQPDGSLAALQGGTWWVLPVRARAWCATGVRLPASGVQPPPPRALRCARAR